MANEKLTLTRAQLSSFLKDPKAIMQFERLFQVVDVVSQSSDTAATEMQSNKSSANADRVLSMVLDLAQELEAGLVAAERKASFALDAINQINDAIIGLTAAEQKASLALCAINQANIDTEQKASTALATALRMSEIADALAQSTPVLIGTMGRQQSDAVDITGGEVTANLKNNQSVLLETIATLSNGAGSSAGTLLNAPSAGNPTKWVPINDNGTTRYVPSWEM